MLLMVLAPLSRAGAGANAGDQSAHSVLVLGDSISAGYGLADVGQGWVNLLAKQLAPQGFNVVNASISGDTTAGGLARIDELLSRVKPSLLILELGGNDGLRGLTPAQMENNLTIMINNARASDARVLLLGMRMPPNYGKRYAEMFQHVYGDVASKQNVALVPFLLEGIGGHDDLMQTDGIHPNAEAQPIMLELVMKALDPLLKAQAVPAAKPVGPKQAH